MPADRQAFGIQSRFKNCGFLPIRYNMAVKTLRFFLVLVIVIVAVWQLAPHFKDFKEIYNLRNHISYLYLVLSIFSQAGQYLGDAWLSQTLLKVAGTRISFSNTFKIASMNVFAANLLPVGQAGALAAAFYFYKKLGVTNQNFIFLSICWTLVTTITLAIVFLLSLIGLPEIPHLGFNFKNLIFLFILVIALIALASFISRTIVWPRVRPIISKNNFYREVLLFKKNFPNHKDAIFKNKSLVLQAFTAALIFYLSNILTLTLSCLTFGIFPHLYVIAFAYSIALVAGWITLAPAGLGATEATMLLIFLQFNIPPAQAIASILLFRIMSFWIPIPIGALAYFSLNRQFNKPH